VLELRVAIRTLNLVALLQKSPPFRLNLAKEGVGTGLPDPLALVRETEAPLLAIQFLLSDIKLCFDAGTDSVG
jgi:hypothetical protein